MLVKPHLPADGLLIEIVRPLVLTLLVLAAAIVIPLIVHSGM